MKTHGETSDLKVFGYINLTRLIYNKMKDAKGVILNIIGLAGQTYV